MGIAFSLGLKFCPSLSEWMNSRPYRICRPQMAQHFHFSFSFKSCLGSLLFCINRKLLLGGLATFFKGTFLWVHNLNRVLFRLFCSPMCARHYFFHPRIFANVVFLKKVFNEAAFLHAGSFVTFSLMILIVHPFVFEKKT